MNDGDWICSDANCGNINFARRISCYRCNKERPDSAKSFKKKLGTEIGKTAAEKSRGLFNADDWQCNKCANVNWARRQTCNVCNAPKYGEVEARTGYGGGYNERGVVEYRRREPSSDDEYDEFGRKKRKRKAGSEEKVGITEGAVFKKLPPTVLQQDSDMEHVMPVLGTKVSRPKPRTLENVNGSNSDGSVCDISPLTNAIINRYQQVNKRQELLSPRCMVPTIKPNGVQTRKRYISTGEKDHTASSGYDTCTKKSKRDSISISPVIQTFDPVMENMVSSTNNDVVYKFTGPTPAADFEVTYTIEERIRAAAFAIVFNNCKISTDKFETLYDKPAPDFKTIFGWRHRLLTTGCLVDSHIDTKKEPSEKPPTTNVTIGTLDLENNPKGIIRMPNPDEIMIPSESDEDVDNNIQKPLARSVSAETLVIPADKEMQASGSAVSAVEGRAPHMEICSPSPHRRNHSSSRDSQDSHYPDTDSERLVAKSIHSRTTTSCSKSANHSARQSIIDSDSDSVSFNSEEDNFLSRVFPNREGRKKRKVKRRSVSASKVAESKVAAKVNNYIPLDTQKFEGYSTVKPTTEQSPLVTGNIYTTNLRNMNVKTRENITVDVDHCSSEYVPTRLGSSAKQNYQEFKDNVRKKGYWAKGNNGATIVKNRRSISMDIVQTPQQAPIKQQEEPVLSDFGKKHQSYEMPQAKLTKNQSNDFPKEDVDNFIRVEKYLPFEPNPTTSAQVKPIQKQANLLQPIQPQPVQMQPLQKKSAPTQPAPVKPVQMTSTPVQPSPTKPVQAKPEQIKPAQPKPIPKVQNVIKSPDHSDRFFAFVQESNAIKNKSIMDLFDNNGHVKTSPEKDKELEKYDSVRKIYASEWDEDDDDLYKNTENCDPQHSPRPRTPSPNVTYGRTQSPMSNMLYTTDEQPPKPVTPVKSTVDLIKDKQELLLDLLKDFQNKDIGEVLSPLKHITPQKNLSPQKQDTSPKLQRDESNKKKYKTQTNIMTNLYSRPEPIPRELSDEVIRLSGDRIVPDEQIKQKNISPSKKVHVIESVTIQPVSNYNYQISGKQNVQLLDSPQKTLDNSVKVVSPVQNIVINKEAPESPVQAEQPASQPAPQLDLSNLLSGINTNSLLLALQNLQQLKQNTPTDQSDHSNNQNNTEPQNATEAGKSVETINLTNDEEWEKESNRDGSIERQLERLDGNTGDSPFLGDIFDPGPVIIPPNVARKLNLDVESPEDPSKSLSNNENAAVIGNFKSFVLPKPILLNRLKVTVKAPDKSCKKSAEGNRIKRKKKSKSGSSHEAGGGDGGDDDDDESGDEADLSKYDLWGSDAEPGNSSKTDKADKAEREKLKDGENSKEGESKSPADKNDKRDKSASPVSKSSKRRSRSSSSSSTSSSSSSSSHSSSQAPKNKFDDFNLNSERELSPKGRKSRSRSRSPRSRSTGRRKSRDSRSAGESRSHEASRDKEWSRDRERRDRSRGNRDERKERRYSRDGSNHYGSRGRHR